MALSCPMEMTYWLQVLCVQIMSVCVCVVASSPVVTAGCEDYLRKCRGVAVMKRPPRQYTHTYTHTHIRTKLLHPFLELHSYYNMKHKLIVQKRLIITSRQQPIQNVKVILARNGLSVVICPLQSHLSHYPSRVIKRKNITSNTPPLSLMDRPLSAWWMWGCHINLNERGVQDQS